MSDNQLIPATMQSTLSKISSVLDSHGLLATGALDPLERTVVLAQGIKQLKALLTDELCGVLMELQGSRLGFRTDKDSANGYPVPVVREVAAEALMRGARMVGNEVNIIASSCYLTLEYYERMVRNFPGVTNFEIIPGVPVVGQNGAMVPMRATYMFNGEPQTFTREKWADPTSGKEYDERIAVRVNSGQIVDAIIGKARRKFLKQLFEKLTGINFYEPDDEPDPTARPVIEGSASKRVGHSGVNDQLDQQQQAKPAAASDKEEKLF